MNPDLIHLYIWTVPIPALIGLVSILGSYLCRARAPEGGDHER